MRKVSTVGLVVAGLMMCAAVAYFSVGSVQARPQYVKGFAETYPDLADAAKAKKCALCHMGEDKKVRNEYGKAFGAGLTGKNEKDAAKLTEAFKKAETAKNAAGTEFGAIIKEGKLPE